MEHHGTSWNIMEPFFQPFSQDSQGPQGFLGKHGQPHGSFDGGYDIDRYEITLAGNWPTRAREDLSHGQGINSADSDRFWYLK